MGDLNTWLWKVQYSHDSNEYCPVFRSPLCCVNLPISLLFYQVWAHYKWKYLYSISTCPGHMLKGRTWSCLDQTWKRSWSRSRVTMTVWDFPVICSPQSSMKAFSVPTKVQSSKEPFKTKSISALEMLELYSILFNQFLTRLIKSLRPVSRLWYKTVGQRKGATVTLAFLWISSIGFFKCI